MKLQDMLAQQEKRGIKKDKIKAKMQSYDDYIKDDLSPRPYNTPNVLDLTLSTKPQVYEVNEKSNQISLELKAKIKEVNIDNLILKKEYKDLSGNEKRIIDEIAYQCVLNKSVETEFIAKEIFSQRTTVKIGAIKTSVRRLIAKGILVSYEALKGRHSAWKFFLSPKILEQYINSRSK